MEHSNYWNANFNYLICSNSRNKWILEIRPHKVNFQCLGQFSLSYLTYMIRCNQYSAWNNSVYTTCTQWLTIRYTDVCIVPSTMHFAGCTPFSFHFGFGTTKKKSLVAWSFKVIFRTRNRKLTLCSLSSHSNRSNGQVLLSFIFSFYNVSRL